MYFRSMFVAGYKRGQTKVTMDTPSSYCTTTDNFLLNEP